jgi:hypothetical protein
LKTGDVPPSRFRQIYIYTEVGKENGFISKKKREPEKIFPITTNLKCPSEDWEVGRQIDLLRAARDMQSNVPYDSSLVCPFPIIKLDGCTLQAQYTLSVY